MSEAGGPDYDAPCPACKRPIGDHTMRGYAEELREAGFDYKLPHTEIPGGPVHVDGVDGDLAGEVVVAAMVWTTPLGRMPVLRFQFSAPGEQAMSRVPLRPVNLVMDVAGLRNFRELVAGAVDRAVLAAVEGAA